MCECPIIDIMLNYSKDLLTGPRRGEEGMGGVSKVTTHFLNNENKRENLWIGCL